jgi:SAM-dependent methyltransferase
MTFDEQTGDHVARNRASWNLAAAEYAEPGRQNWASEPRWGIWGIPESDVHLLPEVDGLDVIELGCGTGYVSAWLARRGCDPYRWIPEAARLLRPGGRLIFLGNGALLVLTMTDSEAEGPAGTTLRRDYFGMHRFEWPDEDNVEFHLTHGDWIRLLRRSGFEVEDLIELRPSEDATTTYPFVTLEWSRRWPSEEVWIARRTGATAPGAPTGKG